MGHYVSFIIQSWQENADGTMRWQVCCTHDPAPLTLPDSSFVVRTWIDDQQLVRGLIRHVQSGREMQFQSSQRAIDFIETWLKAGAPHPTECPLESLDDAQNQADELPQEDS
jgi:hypothetical protein